MLARRSEPRRLSTQNYLLILVAAVVIPLLVFAGFVLTRYAASERARFERDAAQIAHQVAVVVDSKLAELVALLKGSCGILGPAGGRPRAISRRGDAAGARKRCGRGAPRARRPPARQHAAPVRDAAAARRAALRT